MSRLSQIPPSLQTLSPAIKSLYYKGDLGLLQKRIISIVGARRASNYAKDMTYLLAKKLAQKGFVIASGGAMGIDAKAHEGAFPHTIGIFANSLDAIYPSSNKNLIERIYASALALSEQESGYLPQRYDFVLRNRITVALGEILIISEADINSGSMRSAEFALKSGKKIYVLPHRLGESSGTNALVREGKAEAIYDIETFVDSLGGCDVSSGNDDALLRFCESSPFLDSVVATFGEKVFEYEIEGLVAIIDGRVKVV